MTGRRRSAGGRAVRKVDWRRVYAHCEGARVFICEGERDNKLAEIVARDPDFDARVFAAALSRALLSVHSGKYACPECGAPALRVDDECLQSCRCHLAEDDDPEWTHFTQFIAEAK